MTRLVFWLWLLALLCSPSFEACAQSPAQSSIDKQFIGTWRLVGATQKLADGSVRPSPAYGPNQLGYMIYTDDGHMCSVTVNADRPKWVSPQRPTDAELRSAWDGMGSYCATYTVNAKEKFIVHHVEFDKSPNGAGADRKRFYIFEGNRLILKIDPGTGRPQGNVVENTVTWERVAK
jgi:hypothetical protein